MQRMFSKHRRLKRPLASAGVDLLKAWVEIVAIVIAGAWAVWNFNFKERLQPKTIPGIASIEVRLTLRGTKNNTTAVEAAITVDNQSPRTTYLLATGYMLLGRRVRPRGPGEDTFFEDITTLLRKGNEFSRDSAIVYLPADILASGVILEDWHLDPKEVAHVTKVLYMPAKAYDEIVFVAKSSIADEPAFDVQQSVLRPGVLTHTLFVRTVRNNKIELHEMTGEERGSMLPAVHYTIIDASTASSMWVPEAFEVSSPAPPIAPGTAKPNDR